MQLTLLASVITLVASAAALQVTSPAKGSSLDLSKSNTIKWNSVATDPQTFSIELVNMAVNPPVNVKVANDVKTSAGEFTVGPLKDVVPGTAYQFNLVSTQPQNTGILAQSEQFTVTTAGSPSTTEASLTKTTTGPSDSLTSGTSTASSTAETTTSGSSTQSSSGSSTQSGAASATSGHPSASANAAPTIRSYIAGMGGLMMGLSAVFL